MHDIKRSICSLCEINRALVRFSLNKLGTAHIVIPSVCFALGDVLLGERIDKLVVLRVNGDNRAHQHDIPEHKPRHTALKRLRKHTAKTVSAL